MEIDLPDYGNRFDRFDSMEIYLADSMEIDLADLMDQLSDW